MKALKREIKFRAWDGERMSKPFSFNDMKGYEGEVNAVVVNQDSHRQIIINESINEGPSSFLYPQLEPKEAREVFMQYTGLIDKNGKEIYEGDIVKLFGDLGEDYDPIVVVEFDYGGFYPFSECSFAICYDGASIFDSEIIGNVYENPDLLTKITHKPE